MPDLARLVGRGDKHRFARFWLICFFCWLFVEKFTFVSFWWPKGGRIWKALSWCNQILRFAQDDTMNRNTNGWTHPLQRAKRCWIKNVRPHFLSVKWRERYGALKRKSCLSEASSFPLAEYPTGIVQKVQTAVFLFCYLFSFCCQKEKSKDNIN